MAEELARSELALLLLSLSDLSASAVLSGSGFLIRLIRTGSKHVHAQGRACAQKD